MFSKASSEPVEHDRQLNEAEESAGELLIASADAPVAFDATEEVLHLVTTTVVPPMKRDPYPPASFWRDAAGGALAAQPGAEGVRIKSLIRHHPLASQARQQGFHGVEIVARTGRQRQAHRAATAVNCRRELGVEATLGAADRLLLLAATGIAPVLVQLDVRAVEVTQLPAGTPGDEPHQPGKEAGLTPAPEAGVNRVPRAKALRQVAPRDPGAQHEEHPRDHEPVVLRRPAP